MAAFGRRPPVDAARLSLAGIRNPSHLQKDHKSPFYLCSWPSLGTLQKKIGCRRADVITVREELKTKGYLDLERRRGKGKTTINRHRLLNPSVSLALMIPDPIVAAHAAGPNETLGTEYATTSGCLDTGRCDSEFGAEMAALPASGAVATGVRPAPSRQPAPLDQAEAARREKLDREQFYSFLEANQARGNGHTFEYEPCADQRFAGEGSSALPDSSAGPPAPTTNHWYDK
jgi:biotin operon repressor